MRRFSTTARRLAGHSKWQNIKHKKARNDKDRSAQFTRIAHQITVAAKEGGGADPTKNIRLATQIETALKMNLPKRVIETALERASPSSANEGHSIVYEGMGPGGAAYIVEAVTDNKNRTAQNVRAAFTKYGGSIAPCAYLFERRGFVALDGSPDYDQVFEHALDYAQDVVEQEGQLVVYTDVPDLAAAAASLKQHYAIDDVGVAYVPDPNQQPALAGEALERAERLAAALEAVEDVHSVSTNILG